MSGVQALLLAGLAVWFLRPWEWSGGQRRRPERRAGRRRSAADADLASRLESGEITGSALRELMASGQLTLQHNPDDLSPSAKRELTTALRLATEFHGERGDAQVIELEPTERKLPRFVVGLGEMPVLQYEPKRGSKRQGYVWEHKSGDRGFGQPDSPHKPVLAVDPRNRRPLIVPLQSPVRLDSHRGLVG